MSEANTTPVCCNISTQTAPECTVTPWHCGKCSVSQVWTCLSLYLSSNHMHGIKDVIVPKGLVLIFHQMQNITSILSSYPDPIFYESTSFCFRYPTGPSVSEWQSLGLGPQHQTLQGKASNHKTIRAQLKGSDGSEKGKLGGDWMRRMGLREKCYSKESHQSATSSQRKKKIKRLLLGLFGTILEIKLPSDGQGTNQNMGQGNSIIYFILSSLSLLNSFVHLLLFLSHCSSASSVDSPQAEEKLPAIRDLQILSVGNRG